MDVEIRPSTLRNADVDTEAGRGTVDPRKTAVGRANPSLDHYDLDPNGFDVDAAHLSSRDLGFCSNRNNNSSSANSTSATSHAEASS